VAGRVVLNTVGLGFDDDAGAAIPHQLHAHQIACYLEDIAFEGAGCAISTASASVLTEAVRGKTVAEAEALFDQLIDMLTGGPEHAELVAADPDLGSVAAFVGVSAYP